MNNFNLKESVKGNLVDYAIKNLDNFDRKEWTFKILEWSADEFEIELFNNKLDYNGWKYGIKLIASKLNKPNEIYEKKLEVDDKIKFLEYLKKLSKQKKEVEKKWEKTFKGFERFTKEINKPITEKDLEEIFKVRDNKSKVTVR